MTLPNVIATASRFAQFGVQINPNSAPALPALTSVAQNELALSPS
jgi:hypothetical protein